MLAAHGTHRAAACRNCGAPPYMWNERVKVWTAASDADPQRPLHPPCQPRQAFAPSLNRRCSCVSVTAFAVTAPRRRRTCDGPGALVWIRNGAIAAPRVIQRSRRPRMRWPQQ
jgi:hypothetical protein